MEKYHRSPVRDYMAVTNYAGKQDFDVEQPAIAQIRQEFSPIDRNARMPDAAELKEILREMGKTKPEDELNCGSCGYDTCREKAVAIYQGKAEISMCLPFLKEKAESFSNAIVNNSPNALIVVNDNFEVQQINQAAQRLMKIQYPSDVLGDQLVRILDPTPFFTVQKTGRGLYNQRVYLTEYMRFVEQTIVPAEGGRMLICIMRDVTDEENERHKKEEIERETVEVADRVVEKQMRIVQEIASLLGETAAETKIALQKLKETVEDD